MLKNSFSNSINALIFLEGFMVLALQILVSVIVTPYWGNSFVFWSLSLFFVMFSLSIGYLLTPFILRKTKNNSTALLVKLLWFFFVYLVFIFVKADSLLMYFISEYTSLITGNVVTLFFFLFVPVMCLAMVPILIINHKEAHLSENVGEITGKVFSVSSFSGIVAVLLLSFFLIPVWGVLITKIILIALVFLLVFLFLWSLEKKLSAYILVASLVVGLAMLTNQSSTKKENLNIVVTDQMDGLLGQIKVVDYIDINTRFFYVNNAPQSKIHSTGRSLYPYVYSLSIYASCKPAGSEVLLAGMGGGSLVYELSRFEHNIDVVDIDSRLESFVEKHSLVPEKKANFIESDIRRYVNNSEKKYDIIILDLSKGETVPTNVYTLESFVKCKKMLKEDGLLLIHFLSSLSEDGQLALASVGKTLREAKLDYKLMNRFNKKSIMDGVEDINKPNGYIFCAATKVDFSKAEFIIDPSIIDELVPKKDSLFLKFNDNKGYILTDDKPVLDLLQIDNAVNMRKLNIKAIINAQGYEK